ncbi:MAG: archaeal proteasome endopeptidase complex subunit alpha [Candidatus Aenigmatarchaeota archaeon]
MIILEAMPEFMGYDRAIVTFSPDGRLFQVEYAREAVKRGTTSLGIVFDGGVVLAAIRPLGELAIPNSGSDKVHQIDDHLGAAISGFLADGRVLVDIGRVKAQIYKLTYDEPLNVLGAVKEISDRMQLFTQFGGVRPFGVALLLAGIDEKGAQLYEIDPSSTFYSWKAQAIGRGATEAVKILKKGWKEKLSEDDAIRLAISALKSGEKGLKANEIELAVITPKAFKKWYGEEGARFLKKYF